MDKSDKKPYLVDVSVLLVFFARPDTFKQVFDAVKLARPSRLFLYQDGPRDNRPDDKINIDKCRAIAADIDWDCEVETFFQQRNVGCDPSGFIAHTWAFAQTDKCIVLEDDVVPSVSFFSFCKVLLDKYESDERVMLISGFNPTEQTSYVQSDYFFSATTFTWGWASWSRVVSRWDGTYGFLDDAQSLADMRGYIKKHHVMKNLINMCRAHRDSGKAHFETVLIANQYIHGGLTIIPRVNMINNIGITGNSTHYASDMRLLPRGYRRLFTMRRFDIPTDRMRTPDDVADCRRFKNDAYRIYGWGHPLIKTWRLLESSFYRMLHGDFKGIVSEIKQRLANVAAHRSS